MDKQLQDRILHAAQIYIDAFKYWRIHQKNEPPNDAPDEVRYEWQRQDAVYERIAERAGDYLLAVPIEIWNGGRFFDDYESFAVWELSLDPRTGQPSSDMAVLYNPWIALQSKYATLANGK